MVKICENWSQVKTKKGPSFWNCEMKMLKYDIKDYLIIPFKLYLLPFKFNDSLLNSHSFLYLAILMTKIKLLLVMALLMSFTYALMVTSVTLQNAATTTSLQGSVMGGTKLYFEGLGFSSTMDENLIYIG